MTNRVNDQSGNDKGISSSAILLLLFLTFLNMLNFADRALLGNLAKQVHEDLQISYEMIGLLTGFGFVLFYTLMGVLLGTVRLCRCGRGDSLAERAVDVG
jgi:hypothetical protein